MSTTVNGRVRNESVSHDVFFPAYIAGCRAGKTNEEMANELGMKPSSFQVRASQLRKAMLEEAESIGQKDYEPPFPGHKNRSKGNRSGLLSAAQTILAGLAEVDTPEVPEVPAVEESQPVA
jgi:hypothetical protein